MIEKKKLYHVTVLSNFARAFDKYTHYYAKAGIPESTYPDRFYLLERSELDIGYQKASQLLEKLAIPGNRLILLETQVDPALIQENTATGRGVFIHADHIRLSALYDLEPKDGGMAWRRTVIEDMTAASLRLLSGQFQAFAALRPRTLSILPIAQGCQAKCAFCFSKASISSDQAAFRPDWDTVGAWLDKAAVHGAERAVITGGGEPTLLPFVHLEKLIACCAERFSKVVLISNGHAFATLAQAERIARLRALHDAGLRVLSLSRHHFDAQRNERIMKLNTPIEALTSTWREHRHLWPDLRLRFICVLQDDGVEDDATLAQYLTWAADLGVEEICFKELYVSTSTESMYFDRAANDWSRHHQVPLALVTDFAARAAFSIAHRLPWGAPVFAGEWAGRPMRIAAYTEPSLYWERTHGIARSWNVMADGRCFASLEDRASELTLEDRT
ncbi:radical SAM protein [Ralstonia insidiosa]|uniref:radical SAM protein n=1 Tax=Ralstonia insidiosa TaxID=190721 RepID=UPI000CEF0579|nr:radical SAM protein [Ralstonia insidiosa]